MLSERQQPSEMPDADALERRFGDPWASENPLGFGAVLAADEAGAPFAAGELAFEELCAGAVAAGDGGMDRFAEAMRVLARRDLILALRCAQLRAGADVSGTLMPAVCVACLDTCLRATLRHTLRRRLHGVAVADFAAVRSVLAGAFVELLVCDAFCLAAEQARPPQGAALGAGAKLYVGPALIAAVERLSEIMGAYFYIREGESAIFQKHLRDLKQAVLTDRTRPAIHRALLRDAATGAPEVLPTVLRGLEAARRQPGAATLATWLGALAAEVEGIATAGPATPDDHPASLDRAERFASLLATAACVDRWLDDSSGPLLCKPAWLMLALQRLRPPESQPEPAFAGALELEMFDELLGRLRRSRGFGLVARPLPDRPVSVPRRKST